MKAKRWDWAHKKQKNIEVTINVMILIIECVLNQNQTMYDKFDVMEHQ